MITIYGFSFNDARGPLGPRIQSEASTIASPQVARPDRYRNVLPIIIREPGGPLRGRPAEAKIVWAHGGCLGTGSRRRTRQAAIVPGEAQTAFDPGVSEWGNPPRAAPRRPQPNEIGCGEATRGTETSKYPEEEKSTEIARVAASESAPAQTGERARPEGFAPPGLRDATGRCLSPGARSETGHAAEAPGKARRRGRGPRTRSMAGRESRSRVGPDTWNPVRTRGDHPPTLNTLL